MPTKSIYHQPQPEERTTVTSVEQRKGDARACGRFASNVSQELTRNTWPDAADGRSAALIRS